MADEHEREEQQIEARSELIHAAQDFVKEKFKNHDPSHDCAHR